MIVHNPPNQGGIVQYCILLTNQLIRLKNTRLNIIGFKSLWPSALYPGNEPDANANAIDFELPSKNIIAWYNPLSWINAWLKVRKSDIIHFHWYTPIFAPVYDVILTLNKLFSKRKVVMTCHNIEPHEDSFLDKILIKSVFSKVDQFIVHASENKERLRRKYKISSNRTRVINHGTFGYFKRWSKESKDELKKQLKVGTDTKNIILFFGYIRKYKGLEYLIKALPSVLKEEPKTKVIVAGTLWGNWEEQYGKYIKKNKLKEHFIINPYYVHDINVHKYFDVADIVVLPYFNTEQTISGPLLVSFAFGKPTIVSSCGGIKTLVNDKENAILVKPGDIKDLSRNIVRLLRDKKLQITLSKNALKSEKGHTWDKMAEQHAKTYDLLIRKRTG